MIKIEWSYGQATSLLSIHSKEINQQSKKVICISMFSAALFIMTKIWKQLEYELWTTVHSWMAKQNMVYISSVQFSSAAQSCLTLCDTMNHSMPGLPVHHQLLQFTQTHVHRVSDAIQSFHSLTSPSPAPNPSQHHSLFQWVNSSHEVAKVLEFQL